MNAVTQDGDKCTFLNFTGEKKNTFTSNRVALG